MAQATNNDGHILALDFGDKRVGVALANLETRFPRPLITLDNNQELTPKIKDLIREHQVKTIVVGLPRTLNGQDSQQTIKTKAYISRLRKEVAVKIVTEDEALSSVRAEEELHSRGKIFDRADIDKLAACLILEDYLNKR